MVLLERPKKVIFHWIGPPIKTISMATGLSIWKDPSLHESRGMGSRRDYFCIPRTIPY
jgi:hypothetical protein